MNGRLDVCMDGCMTDGTYVQIDGDMHVCMDERIDGWLVAWMDVWTYVWLNGGCID